MTFQISWAFKNLIANPRRTAKKVAFISVSLFAVLLCLAAIDGSNEQMSESIYYSLGDIAANSRVSTGNIAKVLPSLKQRVGTKATLISVLNRVGQILGSSGYADVTIKGVDANYLPLFAKSVGWVQEPARHLERGTALLDGRLAATLGVKRGDYVTIKIMAEDGFVNTVQLQVDGVFMGNPYLYDKTTLMNIEDARDLFLEPMTANQVMVFDPGLTPQRAFDHSSELSTQFFQDATFATKKSISQNYVFAIFTYYRILTVTMVAIVAFTFVLMLYFAMQNIYYIEFRSRRNELSTLLTFGMKPGTLLIVTLWETFFAFLLAAVAVVVLLVPAGALVGVFQIRDLSLQELVAMLGGNRIKLVYVLGNLVAGSVVVLLIALYSSYKGAKNYVALHIREIITTTN